MRATQEEIPQSVSVQHVEVPKVHTSSRVRAFVLTTFGGYHVFRTECAPKYSALGGIAYSKSYWLRRD